MKSIKRNMFTSETIKRLHKISICQNCNNPFAEYVSLAFIEHGENKLLCDSCADYYINSGVPDVNTLIKQKEEVKQELVNLISKKQTILYGSKVGYLGYRFYNEKDLTNKDEEQLKKIIIECDKAIEKLTLILSELTEFEELEPYLKTQYKFHQFKDLVHPLQIEVFFSSEEFYGWFDCGCDTYEEVISVNVKIGNKYYKVTLEADYNYQKDVGNCYKLYWVDEISKVTWTEIEKPKLKEISNYNFVIKDLTDVRLKELLDYLQLNKFEYENNNNTTIQ